jgi:hypothetical protein
LGFFACWRQDGRQKNCCLAEVMAEKQYSRIRKWQNQEKFLTKKAENTRLSYKID